MSTTALRPATHEIDREIALLKVAATAALHTFSLEEFVITLRRAKFDQVEVGARAIELACSGTSTRIPLRGWDGSWAEFRRHLRVFLETSEASAASSGVDEDWEDQLHTLIQQAFQPHLGAEGMRRTQQEVLEALHRATTTVQKIA